MLQPADKTRVLIVDDHPMLRERLALLIDQEPDMAICGEADNIQAAMCAIEETRPDIAVVDITLKGSSGLELIKDLKARELDVPVLVLSMHDESLYAERAMRAGARGYITKDQASEHVMAAIRTVLEGKIYVSTEFASQMLGRLSGKGSVEEPAINALTDRELEVFQMIGAGNGSREIAETLHLGIKTVDTYRERIKQKLKLKNAAELYQAAVRHQASLDR